MIRYIIHLKDGVNVYYAGDDTQVSNRWTSISTSATRWRTDEAATTFMAMVAETLAIPGEYNVKKLTLSDIPDYSGVH
jgi:hypothetical protein